MQNSSVEMWNYFLKLSPFTREIIYFNLRRHAIQFELAQAHYISFQFPTDPVEQNIHKGSDLVHLSIEIRCISY